MTRKCLLCGHSTPAASYHVFPKDVTVRAKWKEFCLSANVEEASLSNTNYLCSSHFLAEDYLYPVGHVRNKLRTNAVPSVLCLTNGKRNYAQIEEAAGDNCVSKHLKIEDRRESEDVNSEGSSLRSASEPDTPIDESNDIVMKKSDDISPSTPPWHGYSTIDGDVTPPNVSASLNFEDNTITGKDTSAEPGGQNPFFKEARYVGDIRTPHLATPRRAKRAVALAKLTIARQKSRILNLQQTTRRLKKRITTLKGLVQHLKQKNLITEDAADDLMNQIPEPMKQMLKRKKASRKKYPPELRAFALTLSFYSTKAYNYVRKSFHNLLPEASTIRKWYSVIDGHPGFTAEVFESMKCKVKSSRQPILCNIVIDEISVRQRVLYDGKRYYGFVDLGVNSHTSSSDDPPQAKNALFFMAVGINSNWKVPLGYFMINSLTGKERATLLERCLELMNDTGAKVHSITFDGAKTNINMCKCLGANFELNESFKPFFINPSTNEKVFCFFDPSHMLKLVRNTLGSKHILKCDGNDILWQDIKELHLLEQKEGLRAGTKLTNKHIAFENNVMNVKLAAQTLSESVSVALQYVHQKGYAKFKSPVETAKFCLMFNNAFDLLNVRSRFSKPRDFNIALTEENYSELRMHANNIIEYIKKLKTEDNTPLLESSRATGFLGFIICLTGIFGLFDILKKLDLQYFLTYKISQDHIETFFSALRSRGGFNDDPDAKQLEAAYKRLMIRHEISASERGNCLISDVQILFVSSEHKKYPLYDEIPDSESTTPVHHVNDFDHDYISTLWSLSDYIEDVTDYISGFVIRKLMRNKNMCDVCALALVTDKTDSALIKLKNKGQLLNPSKDVRKITHSCERIIRENSNIIFVKRNIKDILLLKVFNNVIDQVFTSSDMQKHIEKQDAFDNHRVELVKQIIQVYLKIRLFHEGRFISNLHKTDFIRHKYTKLIHFKHQ